MKSDEEKNVEETEDEQVAEGQEGAEGSTDSEDESIYEGEVSSLTEDEPVTEPDEGEDEEPVVNKSRVQERIDKITREKYELQRRLDVFESVDELIPQTKGTKPKPALADFEDEEQYLDAMTSYKIEEKMYEAELKRKEKLAYSKALSTIESGVKKYGDEFIKIATPDTTPIKNNVLYHMVIESKKGHDIVKYLADDAEYANKINSMSDMNIAREVGRLEVLLSDDTPVKKKNISKAPAPIKMVTKSSGAVSAKLSDMSMSDFIAARKKQQNNRRL